MYLTAAPQFSKITLNKQALVAGDTKSPRMPNAYPKSSLIPTIILKILLFLHNHITKKTANRVGKIKTVDI